MGKPAVAADELLNALARGREDHQFFAWFFFGEKLHDGQLEFTERSEATINILATSNRWGKTFELRHKHFHKNIYKAGGEPRYLTPEGVIDQNKFLRLKYRTIHTAEGWETVALVWDDALKSIDENPRLAALIKDAPKSLPPKIDFVFGSRWTFRTLNRDASGIDGNSFYYISIDEAGWIPGLEAMMNNVIRVRVADVTGTIDLVGTMKPGISRDFYKYGVRASAFTGAQIDFAHDSGADDGQVNARLDASIRQYLREFFAREAARGKTFSDELKENLALLGITEDELADALGRAA